MFFYKLVFLRFCVLYAFYCPIFKNVLKASSALMRARALYCNVFGHVPLWECLFMAFRASSDCSIILSSDSVSL